MSNKFIIYSFFIVCFFAAKLNLHASDSLKLKRNYLWLNLDFINTGNYISVGSNGGLGYCRYVARHVDMGTELNASFGRSFRSFSDVRENAFAFKYKLAVEYKPLNNQWKILKIGVGLVVAKLKGFSAQVGITNKVSGQFNLGNKAVVGIYLYNDVLLTHYAEIYPIDMCGFGICFGGRF